MAGIEMGWLRLLLALMVMLSHLGNPDAWPFLPGTTAVEGFFVISGFLMALTFEKNYRHQAGKFYLNRFLRIYPLYYLSAGIFALFIYVWLRRSGLALGPLAWMVQQGVRPSRSGWLALLIPQLLIFGQDLLVFVAQSPHGSLLLSAQAYNMQGSLSQFLLLPQGWSLAIELCFYLCVPLLLRLGQRQLAWLCAISWLLKILGSFFQASAGPWVNRFFPFELGAFCLGILAYRLAAEIQALVPGKVLPAALAILLFAWPSAYVSNCWLDPFFALLVTLSLPFLFNEGARLPFERLAGELSYPFFLLHIPVIWIFHSLAGTAFYQQFFWMAIPLTLLASYLLVLAVERPMEKIRRRFRAA
jgi:peptidoglycan/LPS O-acetylase OafA/YrhL